MVVHCTMYTRPGHSQVLVGLSQPSWQAAAAPGHHRKVAQLQTLGVEVDPPGGPAHRQRDPHPARKGAPRHGEGGGDAVGGGANTRRQLIHGGQVQRLLDERKEKSSKFGVVHPNLNQHRF